MNALATIIEEGRDKAQSVTREECNILRLAAHDPISSIHSVPKNRTKGIRAWLFGRPYNYALANQRLETLRKTAVILQHRRAVPIEQFMQFRLAGYSREQFLALLTFFEVHADADHIFDYVEGAA